ncbi:MAG: HNH endonuclease [Bdellovibrionia bacterium]
MSLKSLSNSQLVLELKVKVENERKLLMEILYALQEVEVRKLHLEMGYPDLYTFAMKELGYSSGAAYRRISAMRLLQSVPEVAPRLESGELALENASQAQSFFRKEDLRRKEQGEQKLSLDEKREVVGSLLGKSTRAGQRVLMERSPDVVMPTEKTRALPEQKTLVQFVASAELMEKLEELKHLLAHKNFEGRMDVLVEQMADMALAKLRPKEPKRGEESQDLPQQKLKSPAPGMIKRSRYISVAQRRKVAFRDKDGCTYKDPKTGRVCGSHHGLQFDHIVPFSLGGQNSAQNLTLRCGAHNRYVAEQMGLFRPQLLASRARWRARSSGSGSKAPMKVRSSVRGAA